MPPTPRHTVELPPPSAAELAASERLTALIREEIAAGGSIPFSRFMDLALYAPGLGYYAAGQQKFGPAGDFITAPEAYPLFSRCVARTLCDVFDRMSDGDVLEVGAGSGRLAAGVLNELGALGALPRRYFILELSAELRERQAATLDREAPRWRDRARWLERLPDPGFRGVVLANELLDALPTERFLVRPDGVKQLGVGWREDRFVWTETPAPADIVERISPLDLPPGYTSEVGLAAEAWVRTVADRLAAGVFLLIDYGYPRHEFYHPDRAGGTLMCHYRHRAHADPFVLVGLQDITAHVDFTAIAEAGTASSLELIGYTSQAAFLISSGLETMVSSSDPENTQTHLALMEQVKKLTLPHEMGELYKVIAFGRGTVPELRSFALQDRRGRL